MNNRLFFYFLLTSITVGRVFYSAAIELSLDEAYYWLWSVYPAMSYFDHPPMVAWMIIPFSLFGQSEWAVRLPAVLASGILTAIAYESSLLLFSNRSIAFITAVLVNALPLFAIGAIMITPDAPLLLFWSLALYSAIKLVQTQESKHWYAIGFWFGLAMLSKYTAAFFAPCLLLFLLWSDECRHWLFRKEPYLAFALSIVLYIPVLLWNYNHDFASFAFQLSHGMSAGSLADRAGDFFEFWGLQIVITGLFLFFFLVWASFAILRIAKEELRDDWALMFFMSAPIFLFFLFNSLKSHMEGNWSAIAWPGAIIALPGLIAIRSMQIDNGARLKLVGAFVSSLVFALTVTTILQYELLTVKIAMPQRVEISRRFYGWADLGKESDKRMNDLGKESFVFTDRYQIASLLKFYMSGRPESYKIGGKQRFGYFTNPKKLVGRPALFVIETERIDLDKISPFFDNIEPAGKYAIMREGELVREFSFFKCFNYHGGLLEK